MFLRLPILVFDQKSSVLMHAHDRAGAKPLLSAPATIAAVAVVAATVVVVVVNSHKHLVTNEDAIPPPPPPPQTYLQC